MELNKILEIGTRINKAIYHCYDEPYLSVKKSKRRTYKRLQMMLTDNIKKVAASTNKNKSNG